MHFSFEEDAGDRCFSSCCKAVSLCPSNPGAHQLMANCLLSQQKQEQAKEALMKCLTLWLPSMQGRVKTGSGGETAASFCEENKMVNTSPSL